jgi:hypothetical protein
MYGLPQYNYNQNLQPWYNWEANALDRGFKMHFSSKRKKKRSFGIRNPFRRKKRSKIIQRAPKLSDMKKHHDIGNIDYIMQHINNAPSRYEKNLRLRTVNKWNKKSNLEAMKKLRALEKSITSTTPKTRKKNKSIFKRLRSNKPTTRRLRTNKPTTRRLRSNKPTTRRLRSNKPTTRRLPGNKPMTRRLRSNKPTTRRLRSNKPMTRRLRSNKPMTRRLPGNKVKIIRIPSPSVDYDCYEFTVPLSQNYGFGTTKRKSNCLYNNKDYDAALGMMLLSNPHTQMNSLASPIYYGDVNNTDDVLLQVSHELDKLPQHRNRNYNKTYKVPMNNYDLNPYDEINRVMKRTCRRSTKKPTIYKVIMNSGDVDPYGEINYILKKNK